jgi:hypothetical protein
MGQKKERFARIPVSVLESEACTTLNHAAFKVLVILASQYWGGNNGALALTESRARKYGLKGRDTLYRSLRELEARGLIVCTRRGFKSKKVFTLFALGWEPINNRDGQPVEVPQPANNARWLGWRSTVPTTGSDQAGSKIGIHTDSRESLVPIIGSDEAVSVPIRHTDAPVCVPMVGNTLRISGGITPGRHIAGGVA